MTIAQMNLGQALATAGEGGKAASHLYKAIQLLGATDDVADAHYVRAKLVTAKADPEQAAAQLAQAVSLRPGFAEAWPGTGAERKGGRSRRAFRIRACGRIE